MSITTHTTTASAIRWGGDGRGAVEKAAANLLLNLTFYGDDGRAFWRSYCETQTTSSGRDCVAGTASGLNGETNAILYGAFLESDRVTRSFLDAELIPIVEDGALTANGLGLLPAGVLPLYSDGHHLQHWPNHDNHIHVRVSEDPYGDMALRLPFTFEAP